MSKWQAIAIASLYVLAGSAGSAGAQEPQQSSPPAAQGPTLKVETRNVLVDVVVTDKKGKAISGLPKDTFEIAEDGVTQQIVSFEEHKAAPPSSLALPNMPSNVFTNFPTINTSDSVNVLLLDTLNTDPADQVYVRKQMTEYLKTVRQGTQVAIFALGSQLKLVRGFTTDYAGLAVALNDQSSGAAPQFSRFFATNSQKDSDAELTSVMQKSQASPEAIAAVRAYQREQVAMMAGARTELTLQAFQFLARYLSGIHARKNLIWFAQSFPISFVPDAISRMPKGRDKAQQTSDLLTAGQIAIYPVSASGVANYVQNEVGTRHSVNAEIAHAEISSAQIAMETLAKETGGQAFYNTNNLNTAISDAIDNGARYYSLAYSPTNRTLDGKYRRIEVRVPKGLQLSYRRGYYADSADFSSKSTDRADADPLLPLLGFGMPNFDQILFKMQLNVAMARVADGQKTAGSNTEMKGPLTRYRADFAILPQDLQFDKTADGRRLGHLEVMLVAYDADGKIVNILKRDLPVSLTEDVFQTAQRGGLQIREEIDVPAGDVYLRMGIYDMNTGKCGSIGVPLQTKGQSGGGK
jgi:VWFA-related protein